MVSSVSRYWAGVYCICFCVGLPLAGSVGAQIIFTETTESFHARSTAFGDYDNDGWPDVFRSEDGGRPETIDRVRIALLHNEGNGLFVEHASVIQAENPQKTKGGGAIFGDYDNDGDLDIFVPVGAFWSDQSAPNMLLRNDRGVFSDVAQVAELTNDSVSDDAIWLDYDHDGNLDLYVANMGCFPPDTTAINRLYRNLGDGRFEDVTEALGVGGVWRKDDVCAGGGCGGLIAGDFNSDGWIDLYMGTTRRQPNRLFLNNTQGALIDATTSEIADVGPSFGATAGDINNDGEIDIFQAVISQEVTPEGDFDLGKNRSLMLLNIGEGEFLDVTEGVGLGHLYGVQTVGPALQDVDNDGDLDLILTEPFALYFNDGTGYFTENTPLSGIEEGTTTATFGDVNLDGFLDMWLGGGSNTSVGVPGKLYLNNGNDNHWLRVELVGTESNRSAIGARIIASSSGFQQTREIYGGLGFQQDEMVAHFGLRERTQVDELEIRWPSGQTDILTDISADQKIRVIEGRGEYYLVQPSIWEVPPPESVEYGKQIDFVAVAKPALFEPGAEIVRVTGDLSSLGGPEAVPLEDLGDGTYKLEASFVVGRTSDLRDISVFIEQETSLGPHWINLSRNIVVEGDPNTAVTETFAASLPQSITLAQNYPNPFNGSTVIRFALPTVSEVELAIFNLTGQQVATLASGERRAGTYTLRWDGRDDDGRALASGVYLYRLRTGDGQQVETRKLLLIK